MNEKIRSGGLENQPDSEELSGEQLDDVSGGHCSNPIPPHRKPIHTYPIPGTKPELI